MQRSSIESILLRTWRGRGPLACALWPVSLLYGGLSRLRRRLFRAGLLQSGRAAVPVLVVGNVIAGGSGKTPVVMALVRHLAARGLRVGVISRGYGRVMPPGADDCREVRPDSLPAEVGDEPLLVRRRCGVPVFVARRRLQAAQVLLARYPDTDLIVCDDGLQHYALQRDLEICVFDDRGIGNGWLLPAGPLREAWPRPVDLVLHTGAHPALATIPGFRARRALADHAVRQDGTLVPLATLRGKPLDAVAAIAQPEAFFGMLREAGLTLSHTEALPDHSDFDSWQRKPDQREMLICTEKDAVKLWRRAPDALAVPLAVTLDAGFLAALDARVDALTQGRSASLSSASA
ncbi:tetraacyldisaccharide 4'-kinase [Rhodoferax koreense]|uniref:Tetraacyldisaccharide 4'-kinase n=1 Tax=Rhodoferax koreensis TaxID=1842727 RepID=A0A1P8JXN4_9BURK|nr:tetraacyldisaccharide 4'-kinase [Rhodoferax koreense]APW38520.1 tetraacyldisaccharide 4'-kinase [Rhodoferax koreense]